MVWLYIPGGEKIEDMTSRYENVTDSRTDGRTDTTRRHRQRAAMKLQV